MIKKRIHRFLWHLKFERGNWFWYVRFCANLYSPKIDRHVNFRLKGVWSSIAHWLLNLIWNISHFDPLFISCSQYQTIFGTWKGARRITLELVKDAISRNRFYKDTDLRATSIINWLVHHILVLGYAKWHLSQALQCDGYIQSYFFLRLLSKFKNTVSVRQ